MNNHERILNKNDSQLDSLIKKMAQDHQAEVPSPDLIWWRAQILKKQALKDRVERPMMIMRMVAAIVCLAVFLGLAARNWGQFQVTMDRTSWLMMPLGILVVAASLVSAALLVWSPAKK